MKIKLKKEELEVLTYTDIAEIILSNSKKTLKTIDIFKTIGELLELSEDEIKSKVGDFYTSLTTDKRFIALENGLWDLRDRHAVTIEFSDDDEDEELDIDEESEEELDEENEEESLDDVDDVDDVDDDIDDDMEDLSIVTEYEMDEE